MAAGSPEGLVQAGPQEGERLFHVAHGPQADALPQGEAEPTGALDMLVSQAGRGGRNLVPAWDTDRVGP
jgi:hypothetical protein